MNIHKEETKKCVAKVANEFAALNDRKSAHLAIKSSNNMFF